MKNRYPLHEELASLVAIGCSRAVPKCKIVTTSVPIVIGRTFQLDIRGIRAVQIDDTVKLCGVCCCIGVNHRCTGTTFTAGDTQHLGKAGRIVIYLVDTAIGLLNKGPETSLIFCSGTV